MKKYLTLVILITALFTGSLVAAQEDDDPLISAFEHYVDGLEDASRDYKRCEIYSDTVYQQMVCALTFNSRMIMLNIEVELILAGYDRKILKSISQ